MKIDIRDVKAVEALRPLEVAAYLRASGWTHQESKADVAFWLKGAGKDVIEAAVPLETRRRDFALRMGELLQTLAIAEGRSQAEIYSDLLTTYADVIRIRFDDPELADGTLPIEAHAQISQRTRDLLLAAACSALQRRAVWHARKPAQAVEQVRRLRIGQSERGSYTITVISRVGPELHPRQNGSAFATEPPFERQMTQTLATSLATLDRASEKAALSQSFDSIDESVAAGVSANLCDAVAGLWGDDDWNRRLEFSFSWSPARPVESSVPSQVTFTADRMPVIREASRLLKERSPVEEFELEGAVVKLERSEGEPTGKVTVIGPVASRPHRVVLELAEPYYSLAIQAHRENLPFHCVGTLVKEGRGYVLRDARDIAVQAE